MTSTVYVIQEQPGKNLLPAERYGRTRVLLPPELQVGLCATHATRSLREGLARFGEHDYLLLIGDPVLIGIATAIALGRAGGRVRLLKWDRQERVYYPITVNINESKGERDASQEETTEPGGAGRVERGAGE